MQLCNHKGGAGLACSLSKNTKLVYSCSSGVEMLDSHQQSLQDQAHDESLCPQCQMAQNPQGDPRKVGGSGRRGGWSGAGPELKANSTSFTGQSFGVAHTQGESDASAGKGSLTMHSTVTLADVPMGEWAPTASADGSSPPDTHACQCLHR